MRAEGGCLRVRVYPVLIDAIERGAAYGVRKAFKYSDVDLTSQQIEALVEAVTKAVSGEILEAFFIDDKTDEDEDS